MTVFGSARIREGHPYYQLGINANTPLRMIATTVMAPQSAIGGPRSDIYGMGNLTGVPMAALPMGSGKSGMPVGFQLVAPAFDEAILLRVGNEFQRRTKWHLARPAI